MPMTPQLFSISGAAVELGMDRRTIAAALTDISPDGKIGKHPAWRLRTILTALGMGKGSRKISNADLDEIDASPRHSWQVLSGSRPNPTLRSVAR
jgi:hypothetical protein